ncbi:Phosphoglycerate kinase [Buchnera aphidicola (Tetraneura ulmi)]|uniref:phosphoglycerate kinase n=1 Tax=Buchnera aphidicola TaxID=9 RepID=UPI003464739D
MKKINDMELNEKKILIRCDLNVPMKNNKISSYSRIIASLPTIKFALKKKTKIIIMSHLGRPKEGVFEKKFSLYPIYLYFKKIFPKIKVNFCKSYLTEKINFDAKLTVLENVRFNVGEKSNNEELAKKYANLCDLFVMDAFGVVHRKHSSTYNVIKFSKKSCAGILLIKEINALTNILKKPKRPMIAIIGGSKISTKFNVLNALGKITDNIIVGGGIANTFIAIKNNVGKSLFEKKFVQSAKKMKNDFNITIPIDSHVATEFKKNAPSRITDVNNIKENEEIMDFGEKTIIKMKKIIQKANTILWNGPIGVFEFPKFRIGTEILAKTIANSKSFSIAGGGDTLSVIDMFNIEKKISYISTGGGAFLKFIEGKKLPVIEILKKKSYKKHKKTE